MWLFLWDSDPSKIFVGDTSISKVFLWDTQVRPKPWQPWANTLFYYPFQEDILDQMGNTSLSWWTYTKESYWYLCAGSSANTRNEISSNLTIKRWVKTMLSWVYVKNKWATSWANWSQVMFIPNGNTCYAYYQYNDWTNYFFTAAVWNIYYRNYVLLPTDSWHLLAITVSDEWAKWYIDNNEYVLSNAMYWTENNPEPIHLWRSWTQVIHSRVIWEDRTWTTQELSNYYNQTKSKYWL